jgi:hypothetical protein
VPVFLVASYSEYSGTTVQFVFYMASAVAFLAFATVKVKDLAPHPPALSYLYANLCLSL